MDVRYCFHTFPHLPGDGCLQVGGRIGLSVPPSELMPMPAPPYCMGTTWPEHTWGTWTQGIDMHIWPWRSTPTPWLWLRRRELPKPSWPSWDALPLALPGRATCVSDVSASQ